MIHSLPAMFVKDFTTTVVVSLPLWTELNCKFSLRSVFSVVTDGRRHTWKCFKCLGVEAKGATQSGKSFHPLSDASSQAQLTAAVKGRPSALSENIVPQPELRKPPNPRERIEQRVSHARRHAYGQNGAQMSFNGRGNHQNSADGPEPLKSYMEYLPETKTSVSASCRALQSEIGRRESSLGPIQASNESNIATIYHSLNVEDEELIEVPNTPTQRSSQFYVPEPMPIRSSGVDAEAASPDDSSILIEPRSSVKTASTTVLCLICQTQRVLAEKGNTGVL
jgi:hypothetical protein